MCVCLSLCVSPPPLQFPLSVELVTAELSRDIGEGKKTGLPTPKKKRYTHLLPTLPPLWWWSTSLSTTLLSLPSSCRRVKLPPPPVPQGSGGGGECEEWKRMTVVLEQLEHRLHLLSDSHQLVPVLFNLLSRYIECLLLCIKEARCLSMWYSCASSVWRCWNGLLSEIALFPSSSIFILCT